MPDWIAHAGELRRRLLVSLTFFLITTCVALFWVSDIISWLTRDAPQKLQFLSPTDVLWMYMTLATIVALIATIPFVAFQLWRFVSPGLTPKERSETLRYVPLLSLLFILGIAFGYFIVYPTMLMFLTRLAGDAFVLNYTAEHYVRFILHMTIPFGIIFELPAITMFLTRLGVINGHMLASARKIAYLILTIIGVSLTPPDIVSDVLVTIPLIALYEVSVFLSRRVHKRMHHKNT